MSSSGVCSALGCFGRTAAAQARGRVAGARQDSRKSEKDRKRKACYALCRCPGSVGRGCAAVGCESGSGGAARAFFIFAENRAMGGGPHIRNSERGMEDGCGLHGGWRDVPAGLRLKSVPNAEERSIAAWKLRGVHARYGKICAGNSSVASGCRSEICTGCSAAARVNRSEICTRHSRSFTT